jgi:hypothetical protein
MNRTQLLALLNKWGVTVPADATDEQIVNLVSAGPPATVPGRSIASPEAASRISGLLNRVKELLAERIPDEDPDAENKVNMARISIGLDLHNLLAEINTIWD